MNWSSTIHGMNKVISKRNLILTHDIVTQLLKYIIITTMARQPYMVLGLLFPRLRGLWAFAAVRDRPTGALFQLEPDVTRAIWQSVRRILILLTSTTSSIHSRKVLLHAVNLRHGTYGFTSLRRKQCSGFLSPLKIHRPRSGSNPRTLGPVASTLTTSPPRSTQLLKC
jgi:hypothetical protein